MNIRSFSRIGYSFRPTITNESNAAIDPLKWAGDVLLWNDQPLWWNSQEYGAGLIVRANVAYGFKSRTQGVG